MEISRDILFIQSPQKALAEVINQLNPDKVAFLVDENTSKDCLQYFDAKDHFLIEINSGEINKNIRTCEEIWKGLTEAGFSRKSLLVNLGGGVIGDMGGFTASTYKRGIRFINFPTTLLAMVDANIGGKLGIDFMGFKNHIGLFNDPDKILIYVDFLKTLPPRELRSGYAEVIKHGLIYDASYWGIIKNSEFPNLDWEKVIQRSVEIKSEVVAEDPKENGLRKILNFGHTLGHGIETWYLNHEKSLLHGEAIATGMILEAHLSLQLGMLDEKSVSEISDYIFSLYEVIEIPPMDEIMVLMGQDKKNVGNEINFSLLEKIGKCVYDMKVDENMIAAAINFYNTLK
ncbi:MAG: 3-dehydroquinate synthase [Bacteroidota bacterium]